MIITIIIVCVYAQFTCLNGARILGVVPTPSYSHQIPFQPIWRELSLRGHQVTVLTTDPINDPMLTNLTEIDLHFVYEHWNKVTKKFASGDYNTALYAIDMYFTTTTVITDLQLQHPLVKELINNKTEHFDLLIVENFIAVMYAFGERFNCPMIAMVTIDAPNYMLQNFGNPVHPLINSDIFLPYAGKLTFPQRLTRTLLDIFIPVFIQQYIPAMQKVVYKHFGSDFPLITDIGRNISMLFSNGDFIFGPVKPLIPTVVQIGDGLHIKPPKPLPKDLKTFLDDAKDGFIYFSLGSNVKSKDLSKDTVNDIMQVFAELPYRVIWKFELDLTNKPNKVLISKWLPQQDILRHPNIKLFISQGGYQSIEETIRSKVPMLGIPFLGDQLYNVNLIVFHGFGLQIDDSTNIRKAELKSKILEVIKNPKYRNKVEELSNLVLDQPMTGLERAVWWSEYVIRHKGAKHLRSPALDLPTYQFYLLDVIVFYFIIFVLIVYLLVIALKLLIKGFKYITIILIMLLRVLAHFFIFGVVIIYNTLSRIIRPL